MARLIDVYWQVMMDEPLELPSFMERVGTGQYGSFGRDEIAAFLEEAQRDILANIELRGGVNPALGAAAEQRREETREMVAELMRRYAGR